MTHYQFSLCSEDDNICLTLDHDDKCDSCVDSVMCSSKYITSCVSSWKYDSAKKTMEFIIREYKFVATECDGLVSISVSCPSGLLTVIPLRIAFAFRIDEQCVIVCCGNEVHRYYFYV